MSEIDDLEAYDPAPAPINTAQEAARRRNGIKRAHTVRGNSAVASRLSVAKRSHIKPSLPQFKCLRDD